MQGDAASLEELIRRHLPGVRRTVFQMVLDDADADDVTQEVFLRAIRGLDGFDGRSKFSTWLFRISMNTAHTHLRRRPKHRAAGGPEPAERPAKSQAAPDERMMTVELAADVQAALGCLSPALRAALVLTALRGMPPAEAANLEQCSLSTMYWRIHEARKQLRDQLKRYMT